MTERSLLVVAHDLPPCLNPQAIQIGRLLSHLNNEWRVYLATSTYTTPNRCDAYENFRDTVTDKVEVTSIAADPLLGVRMRLAPFLYKIPEPSRWDMPRLKRAILQRWKDKRFDRLVTFGYPFSSHLLGLELKRIFGCSWTAHFSDPWAGNPLMKYGWAAGTINQRWEKNVFGSADQILFVSEETRRLYKARYARHIAKMHVLEHSFDQALYPSASISETSRPLVIRFLGNLYGGRNFDSLFKALSEIVHDTPVPSFKLELILSYSRKAALEWIKTYRLGAWVQLLPAVDYRESLALMKSADLLLLIDTPLPAEFQENPFFPSKLADYMGSGKPILALAGPGSSRRIVRNYGGWVTDPEKPEEIKQTLSALFKAWTAGELQRFAPSAAAYDDYRIETKSKELQELWR